MRRSFYMLVNIKMSFTGPEQQEEVYLELFGLQSKDRKTLCGIGFTPNWN